MFCRLAGLLVALDFFAIAGGWEITYASAKIRSYSGTRMIINVGNYTLLLVKNEQLFPSWQSEWIDELQSRRNPVEGRCEFWRGDPETDSSAAVTRCGEELSGYFTLGQQSFIFEPRGNGEAVIYGTGRRKRSPEGSWQFFNLTDDTIDIGGGSTNDADEPPEELSSLSFNGSDSIPHWRREEVESETGYFVDYAWQTNVLAYRHNGRISSNPPRWLEVVVAVDHTVIAFHGKLRVEQYVLSVMNIVNAIYQDPSLDANIRLVVSKLLLYDQKRQSVVRPGNARKSLENVNKWNKELHKSVPAGENHHDISVWLTRSDIGGPSGYAPVSGACDFERSCALNRDEGLTSAFIIAHEMAHILGLSHDGDAKAHNQCKDEALQGSVMAPMVSSTFNQFLWSSCSKYEFHWKAKKWHCLLNRPAGLGSILLNSTLHATFSMDEQCRMEFGDGYMLCRAFDIVEPCSHLWCGHVMSPLVCKTKKGPPLEGTECGYNKWCVNGYCETVDKTRFSIHPVQHNPQDGGWGDWGAWGPCSRTCGTGVQFRSRRCDSPQPVFGGSDCFGSKEEWRICGIDSCPEPLRDVRAQQCSRLPRLLQLKSPRNKMVWLPYESEQEDLKCKLICISKETNEMFVTGENLLDGTPCSYENRTNICIQGSCQELGCDKKLFSSVREDACGVCGGTNENCTLKTTLVRKKLKRDISRISVIPKQAREIKVETSFSRAINKSAVAFVLKDRTRNLVSLTIPDSSLSGNIVEGAKFYYKKLEDSHLLWSKGPVLSELAVLIYASNSVVESQVSITTKTEYYLDRDIPKNTSQFIWIMGGFGPCSKTCGGGKRSQTKACWDSINNRIALRRFCSAYEKPKVKSEKCNEFSCNFLWIAGKWETCSATCGSKGRQTREIYCLPQSVINNAGLKETVSDEPWIYMVDPKKCGDVKPDVLMSCNRRACPSYWKYGDWSECSSSCGLGYSIREPYCYQEDNETHYTCDELAPKLRKVCRGPFSGRSSPLCRKRKAACFGDHSRYCSLPELLGYCRSRQFRKLCCKSCSGKPNLILIQE